MNTIIILQADGKESEGLRVRWTGIVRGVLGEDMEEVSRDAYGLLHRRR